MNRERIADDIYVFTSQRYVQVTAGAILTKEGVVLIDTLFFPEESRAMKQFLENRLGHRTRYVVNTHYHADHTMGNCLFPHAQIIGHARCRELLDDLGREGLEQTRSQITEFADTHIVLPDIVFEEGLLDIHIGGKTLELIHMPGHSDDLIGVFVLNERILFASDNMMPVPTLFDGRYEDLVSTLNLIRDLEPDSIVQGHGEVILRGEVNEVVDANLAYLAEIHERVANIVAAGRSPEALDEIDIESCGKSRIPLNGFVTELHHANLERIYRDLVAETAGA